MRDHLVTGVSWVSFPIEASFRWWLVTTHGERKMVFQCANGEEVRVPLTDENATAFLRGLGQVINHPELRKAQV